MATQNDSPDKSCAVLSAPDGVAFIEQSTPLTRLHYFDGKFLRADALALEQDYHRARTRLGNLAGGWGVVHGLDIGLSGNRLDVGAGLAITPAGSFVLADSDFSAEIADLLAVAAASPAVGNSELGDCVDAPAKGVTEGSGLNLYEITVGPIAGLCGQEAVFGKLCESACVSSSQHPYWREGVVLRLRPLTLELPASTAVQLTSKHLINRVASGYFAAEPGLTPAALSAAGLASDLWCRPAGLYERDEVVIGLLIRDAGKNRIDAWSARRERMDTQARGYWQGRMAMRPWNVFVAQILQFQCQLAGIFDNTGGVLEIPDDCGQLRELLDKARRELEGLQAKYAESTEKILARMGERTTKKDVRTVSAQIKGSYAELYDLSNLLGQADLAQGALPAQRMLINAGFAELPPAGYLPVVSGKRPLEEQLPRMFGEGVRLHYHAVRRDEIAHLVEEAQHLERISLTRGLDDQSRIEDVEIFVPDGEAVGVAATVPGEWWQVDMDYSAPDALGLVLESERIKAAEMASTIVAEEARRTAAAEVRDVGAAPAVPDADTGAGDISAETNGLSQRSSREVMMPSRDWRLSGLARTEGRADGSFGFALVAQLHIDAIAAELDKRAKADVSGEAIDSVDRLRARLARAALYLSGDIGSNPFALPLNATTPINGELAQARRIVELSGKLTVLFDRPLPGGRSERVVEVSLVPTSLESGLVSVGGRIALQRQGDTDDGELVIDDSKHDPTSSPLFFDWQRAPRKATMSVLADDSREALTRRMVHGANAPSVVEEVVVVVGASAQAVEASRRELLAMHGLAAMPGIDSAIGAAAINTLMLIAEAADSPAFFARARARLFPTLDAPAAEEVRALRDWVMFRRARTKLCCPRLPSTPVKPVIETFQVWHLAITNRADLKVLQNALDRNLTGELAGFPFARVGVLRYRSESTVAEETEAEVQAMWQQAAPAPEVVLGRYWEQEPVTGQGWQNRFRLNTMLEQIKSITTPPAYGTGAIAGLTQVSPPLADGATDGGFLVISLAGEAATRRALIIVGHWNSSDGRHEVDDGNPKVDVAFFDNAPVDDALIDFLKGLSSFTAEAVTLAVRQDAPDAGAGVRMDAILKAFDVVGRQVPAAEAQFIENLSTADAEQLSNAGINVSDYDDIIFLSGKPRLPQT
jgi:hypothetical protein